jgi:hypothetical protein
MSRADYVASVLNEEAAALGLARIALDGSDRATLTFNQLEVTFAYAPEPVELLWLYVDLGSIPERGDQARAFLLQVGIGSWAYGRITVGLGPDGRSAQGFTSIPVATLDQALLHRTLTGLLELALPLRKRLAQGDYSLAPADQPADDAAAAPHTPFGLDPTMLRV